MNDRIASFAVISWNDRLGHFLFWPLLDDGVGSGFINELFSW